MALSPAELLRIEGAISSSNLIRIAYSKKKQPNERVTKRVVRVVEPYEIKDEEYLYAWDTTKGKTIKSFILNNIDNVLVLNGKFEDRYPDAGKAFPTYEYTPPPDARKIGSPPSDARRLGVSSPDPRRLRPRVNTTAFV